MTSLRSNIEKLFYQTDTASNTSFRVSELVLSPCRAYYHRKLGKRTTLNGRMFSGSMLHSFLPELVKGVIKNSEFEVECQWKCKQFSISGHCDVLTSDRAYEFKYSASKIKEFGFPMHWNLQANAYAVMLNRKYYSIVSVNSYTLDVTQLDQEASKAGFDVLISRAKEIQTALKKGKPPEGPLEKWECSYCSFRDECEIYQARKKKE